MNLSKGNSCLTNLVAFYDVMAVWVDKGRAVDIVYFYFSKAPVNDSYYILIGKTKMCGLGECTVR